MALSTLRIDSDRINDQLQQLCHMTRLYDTRFNKKLTSLTSELIAEISHHPDPLGGDDDPHRLLLTRLSLVVSPLIKERFMLAAFGEKPDGLSSVKDLVNLTHEECVDRFIKGELKSKNDTALILHLIENSLVESRIYTYPFHFFINLPETAKRDVLILLANKNPEFFKALVQSSPTITANIKAVYPTVWEEYEKLHKSGKMWDCIARQRVPKAGYLYTFQLKPECRDPAQYEKKQKEIYPAIEAGHEKPLLFLLKRATQKKIKTLKEALAKETRPTHQQTIQKSLTELELQLSYYTLLEAVGYREGISSRTLILPDRETLLYLYHQYRIDHPESDLPELTIASSSGIASDLDFVQANIDFDGILSDGTEFMHDHVAHLLVLLRRASLGTKKFMEIKEQKIRLYTENLNKLNRLKAEINNPDSAIITRKQARVFLRYLPILETLLGAYVDSMTNKVESTNFPLQWIITIPQWIHYLKNRYNKKHPPIFNKTIVELLLTFLDRV
jgi:hypothetical protein